MSFGKCLVARKAFVGAVQDLGAVWLSHEAPGVVPLPAQSPAGPRDDAFALIRNGRDLFAFTDSHGAWIHWRQPSA